MEQLITMCLHTCEQYALKSAVQTLTEYEAQLYEQIAVTTRAYLKSVELSLRLGILQQEKDNEAIDKSEE